MNLKLQRRLAAQILKCSPDRIVFNIIDEDIKNALKEAITKEKIKELISYDVITKKPIKGTSRARANVLAKKRKKGQRRGHGSRKGKRSAREDQKRVWMNKVRLQRAFLKRLKDKGVMDSKVYRELYRKIKGGFFRSKKHLKLYITTHNLTKDAKKNEP